MAKAHDAGNGLKDMTTPITTYRSGPLTPAPIREYIALRSVERGPFNGQQASASNPVMKQ